MNPGFVFSADWHLSRTTWSEHPDLVGDSYFGVQQVIDFCIEHELPLLVGGDTFDKQRPDAASVAFYCQQMDRMEHAGLQVYYIEGQHERSPEQPWMGVHPWPNYIHKRGVLVSNQRVYGLDWLPPGELAPALAAIPSEAEILVTHQVWTEFMGDRIGEASLADVPHVNTVLTGDFHENRVLQFVNASGAEAITYSTGPVSLRRLNEPAQKFFLVYTPQYSAPQMQMLLGRSQYRFQLTSSEDLENLLAAQPPLIHHDCPPELVKPIIEVTYPADLPEAHDRLEAAFGGSAFLFHRPYQTSAPVEVELDFSAPASAGLLEGLSHFVPPEDPDYAGLQRLLTSIQPPDKELEAMYAEFRAAEGLG